jgi:hypothetical protein
MLLLSGETILPMFLLWTQVCEAIHQLQTPTELGKPFWIKPEWTWEDTHQQGLYASQEVGLTQRVCRSK